LLRVVFGFCCDQAAAPAVTSASEVFKSGVCVCVGVAQAQSLGDQEAAQNHRRHVTGCGFDRFNDPSAGSPRLSRLKAGENQPSRASRQGL